MKITWPFVSAKRFWKLHDDYAQLHENHEDLCAKVDQIYHDHDREVRRLHDELHHARQAIYNTQAMKRYEDMLVRQAEAAPKTKVLMDLMAVTDAARAEIVKATGIDNLDHGQFTPNTTPTDE
ncbi:MAG: hypothetical protein EP341_03000 [Sphingomonadales bacterium]|nr:MAG: hypothetical protein EP341_03000 [Sphingomonadales bacterium]